MVNILIPACGDSPYFAESYWPKNEIEVCGKPMLQHVVDNYNGITDKKFIFILNQKECDKFHTDSIVTLLAKEHSEIIKLSGMTGGALCTCLMAIQSIDNEFPLIITNNDQKFDCDLADAIQYFQNSGADAGIIGFDCIHPRWSYVRLEEEFVVEAAEKRPISKNAIAGWYFFKHGSMFIQSAKNAVLKGRTTDGSYYITAALNELILDGKNIRLYSVPASKYHTFYSPKAIESYERFMESE